MRSFILVALLCLTFVVALQPVFAAAQGSVLVVKISSEISKPTEELVSRSIQEAKAGGARLIVYELNTPGGELGSVTDIMNDFSSSPIPVVVWVTPEGASAWSGGTYILMASHIAAMASGTTIGSAQPVLATGEVLNESKYINALSALMRDNARLHNRNETLAESFVTKNTNLGPEEALRSHVIEFVADDLESLLSQMEPYTVILSTTQIGSSVWKVVLTNSLSGLSYSKSYNFAGISQSPQFTYEPGLNVRLLEFLSSPIISLVLFLVGLYAIIIGFKTPGYGLEITGAVMFFLSLIGFGIIGINAAPILFFVFGIVLTLIEIKTHIGVFALAGIGLVVVGSFLVFPLPGWELLSARAVDTARQMLVSVALVMSGIFGFVVYKVAQARRMKVKVGPEQLIGLTGTAVSRLAPVGEIRVEGQIWKAETISGTVNEGESVEIVSREGLILRVKPKQPDVKV
ncbi:MAG: nodulation protein NfeD [Candidatus Bathyarchaeia archaeon]